jgi:predicted enzyme related to lactoylglutathione lyase
MAKITGIGGVFFKSRSDNKELSSWYEKHLGIKLDEYGSSVLNWQDDKAEDNGLTVWHIADRNSEWFAPSDSDFMINYRIDDMDGMVGQLEAEGVEVIQGPESHENGRFAWIMDPDGNKVELWEPRIWDEKNKT